ncbi:MAG TPA: phosphoglucosamine mutase, partial [Gammaproteobacteria bacterium]|nr:phosphoglucosamine mutase [Gammaproteobacteria bacterium]
LEMLKNKGWILGGESSGHILCLDANTTGDGIISALRVLAVMAFTGRSLKELKEGMTKSPQILINVPIATRTNVIDHPSITSAVTRAESRLNGCGRVLLRASGTEALVRVMVEGQDSSMVELVAEELAEVVKGAMV